MSAMNLLTQAVTGLIGRECDFGDTCAEAGDGRRQLKSIITNNDGRTKAPG
jgi:hypothetical protein